MYRVLAILVTLFAVTAAINFQKCDGKVAPIAVRLNGCDTEPCEVFKGTIEKIEIDFSPSHKVSSLKAKFELIILDFFTISYKIPSDKADVCRNLKNGVHCPLDAGKNATYEISFPVSKSYPSAPSIKVKISLVDEHNSPVCCFTADVKVQ